MVFSGDKVTTLNILKIASGVIRDTLTVGHVLRTKKQNYKDLDTTQITHVSADFLCVSCSSSNQLTVRL